MNKKEEEVKNGDGEQPSVGKMIDVVFNPSEEHLPEMTVIPRGLVLPMSMMMMYDHVLEPGRKKTLSSIWLTNFFKLQRSVGGTLKNQGVALAMEQIGAEQEEEDKDIEDI